MKTVGIVIKKELKRYFTDIRMIMGLVLPGVLIFLLYSVMGDFMHNSTVDTVSTNYKIAIVNEPAELASMKTFENWVVEVVEDDLDKETILLKIEQKELDAYIVYEENFYQKMLDYSASSGAKAPAIEIYYNSASENSSNYYKYYISALNQFEETLSNRFDINIGDNKYDLATKEDMTIQIFTMMLPFLLIILLFSGCMAICSESIAGEKERGTIATLLVTPAKRGEIALGKIIALSITSLVSASASFLGLIASVPKLMGGDMSINVYGAGTYGLVFVVLISTVLLFTAALTLISTLAKSVKEASSYAVPLMVVVMLLGVTSFMGSTAVTNPALYFIPVYNSIQCLTGILSLSINPLYFAITIVVNLACVGLGIFGLTKMFNSEKIMFNK